MKHSSQLHKSKSWLSNVFLIAEYSSTSRFRQLLDKVDLLDKADLLDEN